MKTILLVDDEPKVRQHIRTAFPWAEWGFRVCGEAANGEEALRQCERLAPDIALIDITMPVMDGLALLERLGAALPHIRCIMLTAHQDFHYAQQAMQLGAMGYLLKTPLEPEELRRVLERAGSDVDKERSAQQSRLARQQLLRSYHYPMRQTFFEQLLTGLHATEAEIVRQAEAIGVRLPFESYTLLLCQMDELIGECAKYPDKDRPLVEYSSLELVREALAEAEPERFELFPIAYGQFVALLDNGRLPQAASRNRVVHAMHRMAEPLRKYMGIRLKALVSAPYAQIAQTRVVYAKTRARLAALFYAGGPAPAFAEELPPPGPLPPAEWDRLAAGWSALWPEGAQAASAAWLADAAATLGRWQPEPEALLAWLDALGAQAEAALRQQHGTGGDAPPPWPGCRGRMNLAATLAAVGGWVDACARLKAAAVEVRPEIAACLKFIREHLHEELTVEAIARQAQLSPSYVSHLFKKEVGCTVNDYVLDKRIELAKTCLVSGKYLNYELIEKIGFRSYSYFCNVFKKSTGMTPNEYKRAHKSSVSL